MLVALMLLCFSLSCTLLHCAPARWHCLPTDQHLEASTKRTLVENETMVAELAYHTTQASISP
jgi:hypothetical protein